MRKVFLWAAIPGLFAMVALARTAEPDVDGPVKPSAGSQVALSPSLKRLLVALTVFAFANATDAFLIVKATKLGAAPTLAPLLWLLLHIVKASTATSGGALADRFGKRNSLVLGWTVYAVLWASIGFAESLSVLFVLTAVYGVSHGLMEGAERGLIADLAYGGKRGTAFGSYNLVIGLAALAASTTFGAVWDRFGSVAAFCGSASFALLAAGLLYVLVPSDRRARGAA
jgi:MFS family permease